jgi:uncharacterized protein (TIGR02145 family)
MAEGTLVITISNQVTAPAVVAGVFITGWHVPTWPEWETLITLLGGFTGAGGKMKLTSEWDAPNTGADNSSGFSATPGGYRDPVSGAFGGIYKNNVMWSSDPEPVGSPGSRYCAMLAYDNADVEEPVFMGGQASATFSAGNSIRLIKDDSVDPGTVLDYDGYLYNTVKIGTQVWMKSNLRTTHWADGTPIPIVTDNAAWAALTTAGMCYYNNTP